MTRKREDIIKGKIERIRRGEPVRVLDLFSGCGGISLGFLRAGFKILAGIDNDPLAAQSHATNFHPEASENEFALHSTAWDITELDPLAFIRKFGHKAPTQAVDYIVGGPPCPTFTRVGRAKLREVLNHPAAFKKDPRSQLYLPYLEFVKKLRPIGLLMENVPDIINWGGHNLAEEIAEVLEGLGYSVAYTLLNSANYGVPQMRERFFLMGIHESVGEKPRFPEPTRYVDFPVGYQGARDVALKLVNGGDLFKDLAANRRYVPTPEPDESAPLSVTVEEAISDLPPITAHLEGKMKRGARRFDKAVTYISNGESSDYAHAMRNWPEFETDGKIWDHVTRSLSDRDYRLFREMEHGDDYPKAHALATILHIKAYQRALREGNAPKKDTPEYEEFLRRYVPPYDPGKFPNKWRKMEPDKPARTLMAHLGKDSYSHIHYDSEQARVLSVREAARLQSFPDGFKFCGTMNPAFRQIGNAVPPLLSFALAREIREILLGIYAEDGKDDRIKRITADHESVSSSH